MTLQIPETDAMLDNSTPAPTAPADGDTLELLCFQVADQEFSTDIMLVREIRRWSKPSPLPKAPDAVQGVINLRGTVLPIIDLARRLSLEGCADNDRSVIIVVEVNGELLGVKVDAVSDILSVARAALMPPPDLAGSEADHGVTAITIVDEKLVRVLDFAGLLLGKDG